MKHIKHTRFDTKRIKPNKFCVRINKDQKNNGALMVGTPDPHQKLHEYMDGDDVGWPSLSRFGWETKPIWAYLIGFLVSSSRPVSLLFYLFEIIYVKQFDLMGRAQ